MFISPNFGNLRLVAPRVCLVGVANDPEGALPFCLEGIVEGGIKVCFTGERCRLRSWSPRESDSESRLWDEQYYQARPLYGVKEREKWSKRC